MQLWGNLECNVPESRYFHLFAARFDFSEMVAISKKPQRTPGGFLPNVGGDFRLRPQLYLARNIRPSF